jgi:hypothetical protein
MKCFYKSGNFQIQPVKFTQILAEKSPKIMLHNLKS